MKLACLACLALPSAPVLAQGSDHCATAEVVQGPGPHGFDNTGATTDGSPDALCLFLNQDQIERDVWFRWTAPATGGYSISTCVQTAVDTRIAVYDGSCSAAVLGCDDDSCILQSRTEFQATGGQDYVIRIGVFPGAPGGSGTFTIQDDVPTLNPANGHHYLAVPGDNTTTWKTARILAEGMVFGNVTGHLVAFGDAAEQEFVLNQVTGGPFDLYWIGGFQDTQDQAYVEPDGGWKWVTGEPMAYTNWSTGEPNDQGGGENYIQVNFANQWNDAKNGVNTLGFLVEFETGGSVGTSYCPANPNSTGSSATLGASGTTALALNNLVFDVSDLPPNQFGYFLMGATQTQVPVGQGLLCIGSPPIRFNEFVLASGSQGVMSFQPDLADLPRGTVVVAGEHWNFQLWYRDNNPGPASNFSNGIEVLFL